MANRLTKLPTLVYVPAVVGRPGRAAYCTTYERVVSAAGHDPNGVVYPRPQTPSLPVRYGGVLLPPNYILFPPLATQVIRETVCFPADPGVPSQPGRVDQANIQGWGTGARSRAPVPPSGFFSARTSPDPKAVQLGFVGADFTPEFGRMSHSFVVRGGYVEVVEGAETVWGPVYVGLTPPTLKLIRNQGEVQYAVDDEVVYTSARPRSALTYVGAALYLAGDYVEDPTIKETGTGVQVDLRVTLPGLRVVAAEEAVEAGAWLELPQVAVLAETYEPNEALVVRIRLPALRLVASDVDGAQARLELPQLRVEVATEVSEPRVNALAITLPKLAVQGTAVQGTTAEARLSLPFTVVASTEADYVRGDVPVRLPLRVVAVEEYLPADTADGSDKVFAHDAGTLSAAMVLLAVDSLWAEGEAQLTLVLELSTLDALAAVSAATTLGSIVELLSMEDVALSSDSTVAKRGAVQYAINALTGAASEYAGFDFEGFATLDRTFAAGGTSSATYAWRKDGVFLLGAPTDNGELISALVEFGTTDLGEPRNKRVEYVYLGLRTDGQCFVRVRADSGGERVYRTRGNDNMRRSQLAAGVVGRQWTVQLELVDASFAEVDSLEIPITPTQRRGF